jgi:hypothetical protein
MRGVDHLAEPVERLGDAPLAQRLTGLRVLGRSAGRRLAEAAAVDDLRRVLREHRDQLDVYHAERLALVDDEVDRVAARTLWHRVQRSGDDPHTNAADRHGCRRLREPAGQRPHRARERGLGEVAS